jgi:hypothetical protein
MRWPVAVVLALAAAVAHADETVRICYNYGCLTETAVTFSAARLAQVRDLLAAAATPAQERELVAKAVGQLYAWAAEQTPIGADRGGDYADDGKNGRMDCIDHSTTTDRFLHMIERLGWLRFHRVDKIVVRHRWIFGQHFSAVLEDRQSGERYVVDTWFRDNGKPAVVMPLADWYAGGEPDD